MTTLTPLPKNSTVDSYLTQENTFLILLEDGGYIVINYGLEGVLKNTATLTPITKN